MINETKKAKKGNESGVIVIILAVLLVLVLLIVGIVVAKDNKALAKFDGGKVTKSEFQVYYLMLNPLLQSYGYGNDVIPTEIMNSAAYYKILAIEAKNNGIKLTDEDKESIKNDFSNETYLAQLKENGIDIDILKKVYEYEFLIANYAKKIGSESDQAEFEAFLKDYYGTDEELDMNEYDTSHILFSFTKDDNTTMNDEEKAALKTKAEAVLERVKNGEDFATLAQENSDDSSASNGGKYVMYNNGSTVTSYVDAVLSLSEGEVYPTLVESEYGYHIIKLNAKNENGRKINSPEVEEFAYKKFEEIVASKNLTIDEGELNKFLAEIDPVNHSTVSDDKTTDKTNNDDATNQTTDDTTTQEQ